MSTTQMILSVLRRQGRRPPRVDREGRVVVGLTAGLVAVGIGMAAFAAYMLLTPPLLLILDTGPVGPEHLVMTALLWCFGAMFAFPAYAVLGTGVRFSEAGVLHRRMLRTRLIAWSDITEVAHSPITGAYLATRHGKVRLLWHRRGGTQLLEELRARNIRGARDQRLDDLI